MKFTRSAAAQSTAGNVYDVGYAGEGGSRSGQVDKAVPICTVEEMRAVVAQLLDDSGEGSASDDEDDGADPVPPSHHLALNSIALLSPRMLWSFAFHFPGHHLHAVLRSPEFLPDRPAADWAFLDEKRKRELSEKAAENKRQKKGGGGGWEWGEAERGVEAVERLEEAIYESAVAGEGGGGGRPAAQPGRSQPPPAEEADPWTYTIPTAPDVPGLHLCFDSDLPPSVLSSLSSLNVSSPHQLASADPDDLPEEAREGSAPAQAAVLEEIVRLIVDGSEEDYEALRNAEVATVWDLAGFVGAENVLVKAAGPGARKWPKRAGKVLGMEGMDWLHIWSTS